LSSFHDIYQFEDSLILAGNILEHILLVSGNKIYKNCSFRVLSGSTNIA